MKININRQNRGRTKTKYNIVLKDLLPRHQRILIENPIIKKNSTDDRFILSLFKIEDGLVSISHLKRPFFNLESREVSEYASIKNTYKILDWNCAFCKTPIKSKIDNLKSENFVCVPCAGYYKIKDTKKVSELIVSSMLKFVEYYKGILKENQNKFLKYIKKNEKRSTLL